MNIFAKLIISKKKGKSSVYDQLGVKCLMRLRLEFSYLNKHKFQHDFKDTLILRMSTVLQKF